MKQMIASTSKDEFNDQLRDIEVSGGWIYEQSFTMAADPTIGLV